VVLRREDVMADRPSQDDGASIECVALDVSGNHDQETAGEWSPQNNHTAGTSH